ncbi:metallo-beta-lactamase [Ignicoccus islandicus DSM 13165]|uniref:Metallo-beta-lactamase n=1 Tax=Ignicoccus islandicus DSM 13165 TaxID=940295 RepID=A0A0U3F6X6_9CREN|nr:MBL fold metallo-hydrolase [Ignicoccus islandicus]ALU11816.1 metallo-beta-lactamase [Ignicoccus islandicus DSM 13165]
MIPVTPQDHEKVNLGESEVLKLRADPEGVQENYIFAYLIVGREGRVLIETGPRKALPTLKESLREKGFKLSELDAVFVTHIHLDHAGALGEVVRECNCKAYVHPRGLPHLVDPSRLNEAAKNTLGDFVFNAYGEAFPLDPDKGVATEDGRTYEIKDLKIEVVFTPGHAPHHQVVIHEGVLFPGDLLGEVTVWTGAYTPTTPHRTIPPMIIDSIWKISDRQFVAAAYTHRGIVMGEDEVRNQMMGEVEQIRTWLNTIFVRRSKCREDIECYKKYLIEADPLFKKLVEEGELEKSKLLQNSIRMSIEGLMKYVQAVFT